jgi:hypothetical protein
MRELLPRVGITLLFLLAIGCGKASNDKHDATEPRATPSGGSFNLNFDSSFAEYVEVIRSGAENTVWIARSEKSSPDSEISASLENRTLGGDTCRVTLLKLCGITPAICIMKTSYNRIFCDH